MRGLYPGVDPILFTDPAIYLPVENLGIFIKPSLELSALRSRVSEVLQGGSVCSDLAVSLFTYASSGDSLKQESLADLYAPPVRNL